MSGDLLQTKLYIPRLRPSLVHRSHLIEKLNKGLRRKLTLISAPTGFGKTTLVSEWIADEKRPFSLPHTFPYNPHVTDTLLQTKLTVDYSIVI